MTDPAAIEARLEEQEVLCAGCPEWKDRAAQKRTIDRVVRFVQDELELAEDPHRVALLAALHRTDAGETLGELITAVLLELDAEHERALRAEGAAA